ARIEFAHEGAYGADHRVGLVAVRRMAAVRNDAQFGLRGQAPDAVYLVQGSVFVAFALHRQHGTGDPVQEGLDVPGAEAGIQPDVVPAPEGGVGILVVAPQLFRQAGGQVGDARLFDI